MNWSLTGPVRINDSLWEFVFLFLSISHFLNLSSELYLLPGLGQGWMTVPRGQLTRDSFFLQCQKLYKMLLWKQLCHLRDLRCM